MILEGIKLDKDFWYKQNIDINIVDTNHNRNTIKYKDEFKTDNQASSHNMLGDLRVYSFITNTVSIYRMIINGVKVKYIKNYKILEDLLNANVEVIILKNEDKRIIPFRLTKITKL